jgi:hypothetical protein
MQKIKRPLGNMHLCFLDKVGLPPYQLSLRRHFECSEFQVKSYKLFTFYIVYIFNNAFCLKKTINYFCLCAKKLSASFF